MLQRIAGAVRWSRPNPSTDHEARQDLPLQAPLNRLVELIVYAEDCILAGQVLLTADRLSDMLNEGDAFELTGGVRVEELATGQVWDTDAVPLRRDDILLVHAGAPRGDPGRRHRTRQYPIAAKAGPYQATGYIHSLPGTDALASLRHRKPMIALTDTTIDYPVQSTAQQRRAGVLILNREHTDWIVEGHDAETVMLGVPTIAGGRLTKDFTGELLEPEPDWTF